MKTIATAYLLASLAVAVPADAAIFAFTQVGFSQGAVATGGFTGSDLNLDGTFSSFDGEISGFFVDFSGNSSVAAFSLGSADLVGLFYSPQVFSIIALSTSGNYLVNVGPGGTCTPICGLVVKQPAIDFTAHGPSVALVPEPGAWALMVVGFGLIGSMLRRRPAALAA